MISWFSLFLPNSLADLHGLVQLPSPQGGHQDQRVGPGPSGWARLAPAVGADLWGEGAARREEGEDEGAQDQQCQQGAEFHWGEGGETGRHRG